LTHFFSTLKKVRPVNNDVISLKIFVCVLYVCAKDLVHFKKCKLRLQNDIDF